MCTEYSKLISLLLKGMIKGFQNYTFCLVHIYYEFNVNNFFASEEKISEICAECF